MMERYRVTVHRSWICRLQRSEMLLGQLQLRQRTAQWRDFAPRTATLMNSLAPPHLPWRPIVGQELAPQAAMSNQAVVPGL
jgi:hypothetical protein